MKWTIFSCVGDMLAREMSLYVKLWDYVETYDVMWSMLPYSGISCAGDRLAQKMSSYVEFYNYVEAHNFVLRVLTCSGIFFDRACSYKYFWSTLQVDLNRIS